MTRAYKSTLRAEQTEQTRERIVEALAEQLGDGAADFSIPRVAERAGVSVRTVYHHFPNREAQVEAVALWVDARIVKSDPGPTSLADVPVYAERVIRRAVANEREVRAQMVPGVARLVRERRKRVRERALAKVVGESCDGDDARLAAAALAVIISADVGFALMDRFGLRGEELIATHVWIARAAVAALRRGDAPRAQRTRRGGGT